MSLLQLLNLYGYLAILWQPTWSADTGATAYDIYGLTALEIDDDGELNKDQKTCVVLLQS